MLKTISSWFKPSNKTEQTTTELNNKNVDMTDDDWKWDDMFTFPEYRMLTDIFEEHETNQHFNLTFNNLKKAFNIELKMSLDDFIHDYGDKFRKLGIEITIGDRPIDNKSINIEMKYPHGIIINRMVNVAPEQFDSLHYFIDGDGVSLIIINGMIKTIRDDYDVENTVVVLKKCLTKKVLYTLEENGFKLGSQIFYKIDEPLQFLTVPNYMRIYREQLNFRTHKPRIMIADQNGEVIVKIDEGYAVELKGRLYEETIADVINKQSKVNKLFEIKPEDFPPLYVDIYFGDIIKVASAKIATKELLHAIIHISNKEEIMEFDIAKRILRINDQVINWSITDDGVSSCKFYKRGLHLIDMNIEGPDKLLTMDLTHTVGSNISQIVKPGIKNSTIAALKGQHLPKTVNSLNIFIKIDKQNTVFVESKTFEAKDIFSKKIEDLIEEVLPEYRDKPYLYWV